MAWSLLHFVPYFQNQSVCTDGGNIYFVANSTPNVYKYDADADTVTQISNSGSWTGTTPSIATYFGGSQVQWFNNALYVLVVTADVSNNLKVYRYNGSGTSWTQVYVATSIDQKVLLNTGTNLVITPASANDYFLEAFYSADGSSWSTASVDESCNPECVDCLASVRIVNCYGQAAIPVAYHKTTCDFSCDPPYQSYCWFEWSPGSFSVTLSANALSSNVFDPQWDPSSPSWVYAPGTVFNNILLWMNNSPWQYVSSLGGTWSSPGNDTPAVTPVATFGPLSKQCGRDDNFDITFLTGGSWETRETFGLASFNNMVVLNDGRAFVFSNDNFDSEQDSLWGRSEPYPVPEPPVTGNRLWMYRSTNRGQSWESRGIKTA